MQAVNLLCSLIYWTSSAADLQPSTVEDQIQVGHYLELFWEHAAVCSGIGGDLAEDAMDIAEVVQGGLNTHCQIEMCPERQKRIQTYFTWRQLGCTHAQAILSDITVDVS